MNHQNAFIRSANEARGRITQITSTELAKKKLRPVIIDVREEEEFLTGHICGAKHISRGSLKERIGHVVPELTTPGGKPARKSRTPHASRGLLRDLQEHRN